MCSKSKLLRLHATIHTQTPLLQPAPPGSTHDKLTSKDPLCNGLRAFATRFSFCLSPASNGRDVPEWPMSLTSWLRNATISPYASVRLVRAASGRIFSGSLIELAVKRRAADFQPACNFGHLPAIMRDREPDDLTLHFFQRPHFSRCRQHRQRSCGWQRHNRYFVT